MPAGKPPQLPSLDAIGRELERRPPPVPGIPGAKLPPPGRRTGDTQTGFPAPPAARSAPMPPRQDLDATDPSPAAPAARQEPARVERVEPPPRARPPAQEPPRSYSPAPSSAVRVETPTPLELAKHAAWKRLAPWLAALGLSVAGTIGGAVTGYFEGLKAAGRRVAAVEERARLLEEEQARALERDASHSRSIEALGRALAAEAQSNRTERATRDAKLEAVEARLPKIEGLTPPK